MQKRMREWIEAANLLARDADAKVLCPECGVGDLFVKDELIPSWNKVDRYLICNNCGKWNVMTMEKRDDYTSPDEQQ